ncbi:MAG: gephyrin-like molybdotransferase Glp [Thermodesulfobacteriota bacterium]
MAESAGSRDMLGRTGVATLADALALLHAALAGCPPVDGETIPLHETLGRIIAGGVIAAENLPAHPRSTMDGYALRAADTYGATESMPAYLAVRGEVRMGELPASGPAPEACCRIATGGLLPPDTDAVVMLEHTVAVDEGLIEVLKPVAPGNNVMAAGDDVRRGETLLEAGHRLRPCDIGLLAGLGIPQLQVFRQPRVGILSTGDEIVPFSSHPPPGKIRDMNGAGLAALVREQGGLPVSYGIVGDSEGPFTATLARALAETDLVLFSGGSSVGVRDLGERVLEKLGHILLHGVAVKPGKPVIVAVAAGKPVFGLPGHPVSAAVSFHLFVRPALHHLGGRSPDRLPPCTVTARLARNLNSAPGRTDLVPVRVEANPAGGCLARPVLGKSGALSTLVRADGFLVIEAELQGRYEGDEIAVILFD